MGRATGPSGSFRASRNTYVTVSGGEFGGQISSSQAQTECSTRRVGGGPRAAPPGQSWQPWPFLISPAPEVLHVVKGGGAEEGNIISTRAGPSVCFIPHSAHCRA